MGSFTVSISPESGNGNADYEVKVQSNDGFEGMVGLTVEFDSAAMCDLPDSLSVAADDFATAVCMVGNVTIPANVKITGTCGAIQHHATTTIAARSKRP